MPAPERPLPSFWERFIGGARGSGRILTVGLGFVGVLFIAEATLNHFIIRAAQAHSRSLELNSILSVEQLARIGRDLDEERILIGDHITETDPAKMAEAERAMASVATDLQEAMQAYTPPADELPNEAAEWQKARKLIQRFNSSVAEILALSRKNMDIEARAKMLMRRGDYGTVDRVLSSLIELNRGDALRALMHVQSIEDVADIITWSVRIFTLAVFALIGWQLVCRVTIYEKQLKDYSHQLELRNRELDAFAGRVAHDLRNALGPIAVSPFLLRCATDDPKRIADIAGRIERCLHRVTGIIEGLLAFSRAAGNVGPNEAGAVKPVVASVVEEIAPLAARLDVSIELDEIPDVRVRCDDRLLYIVLANLVGNAVKYLEGRKEKRVHISARHEGSSFRIDVEDTGPGIPKAAQVRIFEPFYRVEGTRASGSGIGLATVRRIVDSRGGRVVVESVEGQGSHFQVWFPVAVKSTHGPLAQHSRATPSAHR